jgi:HD-GYP domain-containing protein (c-di-GMP phosphodiesterase class II)
MPERKPSSAFPVSILWILLFILAFNSFIFGVIYKVSESIVVTSYLEDLEESVKMIGTRFSLFMGEGVVEGGARDLSSIEGDMEVLLGGLRERPEAVVIVSGEGLAGVYGVSPGTLCTTCHIKGGRDSLFPVPHEGFVKGRGFFISRPVKGSRFVVYPLKKEAGKNSMLFMRYDGKRGFSVLTMFKVLLLPSWLLLSLVIVFSGLMYSRRIKGRFTEKEVAPGVNWASRRIDELREELAIERDRFESLRESIGDGVKQHEKTGRDTLEKMLRVSELVSATSPLTYHDRMGEKIAGEMSNFLPCELLLLGVRTSGEEEEFVCSAHRYRKDSLSMIFFKKVEREFPAFGRKFYQVKIVHMDEDSDLERLSVYGHSLEAVLVVPLFTGKKRVGTIAFFRKEGQVFTRAEVDMVSLLSVHLATSLENSYLHDEVKKNYFETLSALVHSMEDMDPYLRGHSERVAALSTMMGRIGGLPERRMRILAQAASIHDIGKLLIDPGILHKKGKLSKEEMRIVKQHPLTGKKIIEPVSFMEEVKVCMGEHHERFDGKGYPEGIDGGRLSLEGKIIAVADAFDAMTSGRPYRKIKSEEEAVLEIQKNVGDQFDPFAVELFVKARKEIIRGALSVAGLHGKEVS